MSLNRPASAPYGALPVDPRSLRAGDEFHHWSPTGGSWRVVEAAEWGLRVRSDLGAARRMTWAYIAERSTELYAARLVA